MAGIAAAAAAAVKGPTACWPQLPRSCQHVQVNEMMMGLTGGSSAALASL